MASSRASSRRRAPRRRRSGGDSVLALGRLGVVALGCWLLYAYVPPVHTAARRGARVLARAMEASRLADARRVRLLRDCVRFHVSYALADAIDRAAVDEGVDPELAFRLVRVESGFHPYAVSPVGALGLTQLMPATARSLQPGLSRDDIFDRDTNLHLGFRYLHGLLRAYPGRVDLALHAYNRGPGTVDRIRAAGGDPANGYATAVLGAGADAYRGSGLVERSSAFGLRSSVSYSDSSDALPPTED